MGAFSSRVRGDVGSKSSLDGYPNLVFEDYLASYKLFTVVRGMHSRHRSVVAKVFRWRDYLHPPIFAEVTRIIKRIRKVFSSLHTSPNIVPYQDVEFDAQGNVMNEGGLRAEGGVGGGGLLGDLKGGLAAVGGLAAGESAGEGGRPTSGVVLLRPYWKRYMCAVRACAVRACAVRAWMRTTPFPPY